MFGSLSSIFRSGLYCIHPILYFSIVLFFFFCCCDLYILVYTGNIFYIWWMTKYYSSRLFYIFLLKWTLKYFRLSKLFNTQSMLTFLIGYLVFLPEGTMFSFICVTPFSSSYIYVTLFFFDQFSSHTYYPILFY